MKLSHSFMLKQKGINHGMHGDFLSHRPSRVSSFRSLDSRLRGNDWNTKPYFKTPCSPWLILTFVSLNLLVAIIAMAFGVASMTPALASVPTNATGASRWLPDRNTQRGGLTAAW